MHGCSFAIGPLKWLVWKPVMLNDVVCACHRRTVDHTGPYVRMLLERLRSPKSLSVPPPPPTAAGCLEVRTLYAAPVPVQHYNTLQQHWETFKAMHACWEPWTDGAELATPQEVNLLHPCSEALNTISRLQQ